MAPKYPKYPKIMRKLAEHRCSHCDYDEAEGGLVRHCNECQEFIVSRLWQITHPLSQSKDMLAEQIREQLLAFIKQAAPGVSTGEERVFEASMQYADAIAALIEEGRK